MSLYFRGKKQKGRRPSVHPYTAKDMKRVSWCMKKGISVAVIPELKGGVDDWRVEIKINGNIHLDPKMYTSYKAQTKMYEYYKYYYDRNRN